MNLNNSEIFNENKYVLHRIKFFILILLEIPAVLISLLIFIFFRTHRSRLKIRQNGSICLLLIVNFIKLSTDIPMTIHFFYFHYVIPAISTYCTWWTFLAYSLSSICEFLTAIISIQRHILIFQPHLLQMRLKRYILYYSPLLLCIIYPIIFYMFAIFFYPCDGTQWIFTENGCGFANCYFIYDKVLSTFDWLVNNGLPIVIILVANIALVVRVIKEKSQRQQIVTWRKHRRLTLQLMSVSSLFLIAWLPSLIIALIQQLISSEFALQIQLDYITELIYLLYLLLPWICLGLLPECVQWISKKLSARGIVINIVRPIAIHN
ncbi:unnamed protein product [Adineta ricciae]|uniref:G-protein coupled receptors family 1 profile domain-containing protein n=2 Tax=Adineta ricciae TaxID=249248 RepID=A0A815U4Z4_ADIRI|nr:unnamed protein product [Adineta ricciae]